METANFGSLQGRYAVVQPVQKSLSLPSYAKPNGEGIDHRVIFAALEQKEKKKHKSRVVKDKEGGTRHSYFCLPLSSTRHCRETSLSSDTSCSSVEFQRPRNHNPLASTKKHFSMESKSAEMKNNETYYEDKSCLSSVNGNVKSSDQSKNTVGSSDSLERPERSSRSSTDSLSRKERIEAVKARVEAEREKYVNSSSDEEPSSNIPRYHSDGVIHRTVKDVKAKSTRADKCMRRRSQDDVALRKTSQKQLIILGQTAHQSFWKPPVGNIFPQAKDSDGLGEKIKGLTLDPKGDSYASKNTHGMTKQKNCSDFTDKGKLSVLSQIKLSKNACRSQQQKYIDDTFFGKHTSDLKQKESFFHKTDFSTQLISKNNMCTVEPEKSILQRYQQDFDSSLTKHFQDSDITCRMQNSNVSCAPIPPPRSPKSMMLINKKYFNIKNAGLSSDSTNYLGESHSLEREYRSHSRLSSVECVSSKLDERHSKFSSKLQDSKTSPHDLRSEYDNEGACKISYGKDFYNVFPRLESASQNQSTIAISNDKLRTEFNFPLITMNSNRNSRINVQDCSTPLVPNETRFSFNSIRDVELKSLSKATLKEQENIPSSLKDCEFNKKVNLNCQNHTDCKKSLTSKNHDHHAAISKTYSSSGSTNELQQMEAISSANYKSINFLPKPQTSLYYNKPKTTMFKKCERLSKSEVNLSSQAEERAICPTKRSNVMPFVLDHATDSMKSNETKKNKEKGKSKELSKELHFEGVEFKNGSDNLDTAMKELENIYRSLKLSSENLSEKNNQGKAVDSITESLKIIIPTNASHNRKQVASNCGEMFSNDIVCFTDRKTTSVANDKLWKERDERKTTPSRGESCTPIPQPLCIDDLFHHLTQQLDQEQKLFREEREKTLSPCSNMKRTPKDRKISGTSLSYVRNDKKPLKEIFDNQEDSQNCFHQNVLNRTNPLVSKNETVQNKTPRLNRRKHKAARSLSANLSYLIDESKNTDSEQKKLDLERPQSAIFASFMRHENEDLSQSMGDGKTLVNEENNEHSKNFQMRLQENNNIELKSPVVQDSKKHEKSIISSRMKENSGGKYSDNFDEIWQVRVAMDCNENSSSNLHDLPKPNAYSRLHSVFREPILNRCADGRKSNCRPASPDALTKLPPNLDRKPTTGTPIDEIELEKLLTSLLSDTSKLSSSQSREDPVVHLLKSQIGERAEVTKDLLENVNSKRSSYLLKMDQYLLSREVVNHETQHEDNTQDISEQQKNDVEKLDNYPNQNSNANVNLSCKVNFCTAKDCLSHCSEKEVKELNEALSLMSTSIPQFLHSPLSCSKNHLMRKWYVRRHSVGTEDFSTSAVLDVGYPRSLPDTRSRNVEHLLLSSPKPPGSKLQKSSEKSELTSTSSFNDKCYNNNYKAQAETVSSDSFKSELPSQNIQTTAPDFGSKHLIANWSSSPTLQAVEKLKDKSFKRKSSLNRYDFIQISQPTEKALHQMQNCKQNVEHSMPYENYSNLRLLSSPVFDISSVPQMKRNSCPFSKFDETNITIKTSELCLEKRKNKDSNISKSDTYCRKSHQNSMKLKNMKANHDVLQHSQRKYCSAGEQECFTNQNENKNTKNSLSAEELNSKENNRENFPFKNKDIQIVNNDNFQLKSTKGTCTNHAKLESEPHDYSMEPYGSQCCTSHTDCATSLVNVYDKQCDYLSTLTCDTLKSNSNPTDVEMNQYTNNTEHETKLNNIYITSDISHEIQTKNKHESQTVNTTSEVSYDQILTFKSKCDITLLKPPNKSHGDEQLIKPMNEMSCLEPMNEIYDTKSASEYAISSTNIVTDETENHSETETLKQPNSILRKVCSEDKKELHSILKRTGDDKLSKQPHSILKHRASSEEKDSSSLLDLHSILKKSSSEEENSCGNPDIHPILKNTSTDDELNTSVKPKPILKKRTSFSEEYSYVCFPEGELKPILKKKTVVDLAEEQPKPILKTRRKSEEAGSTASKFNFGSRPRANSADLGIKSILKKQFDEVEINSAVKYLLEKQGQK